MLLKICFFFLDQAVGLYGPKSSVNVEDKEKNGMLLKHLLYSL